LRVSTSGKAILISTLKLIDVYPNDYPNLRGNPREVAILQAINNWFAANHFAANFRHSMSQPVAIHAGKPGEDRIRHAGRAAHLSHGHRIMVQFRARGFPLVGSRTPSRSFSIFPTAKAADFQIGGGARLSRPATMDRDWTFSCWIRAKILIALGEFAGLSTRRKLQKAIRCFPCPA